MSYAAALAEVASIKAKRRESLEDCITAIDAKPAHPLLSALRAEFVAVLAIWDAEEALGQPSASTPPAPTKTPAQPSPSATAAQPKASANTSKKPRSWLRSLLPAALAA